MPWGAKNYESFRHNILNQTRHHHQYKSLFIKMKTSIAKVYLSIYNIFYDKNPYSLMPWAAMGYRGVPWGD